VNAAIERQGPPPRRRRGMRAIRACAAQPRPASREGGGHHRARGAAHEGAV